MTKNWYPFYVGDYARKTSHLTLEQHGAYRLLLDYYYSTGEPPPLDMKVIFRICRAHSRRERDSITTVIEQYFDRTPTGFVSKKCSTVINKQLKYSETQSANAYAKWHAKPMPVCASTKTRTKVSKDTISPIVPLPEWMPVSEWQAFKAMRKENKKLMTAHAEKLAIGKLERFMQAGHDPATILNQSILNNWQDIYEPKENNHATHRTSAKSWTSEGKRLSDELGAIADRLEREEKAAAIGNAGKNLLVTEAVWENQG